MTFVALRMLMADTAKYVSLIFAIAFSTFLIAQQASVFISLLARTTSQIRDVVDAEIWVMHPATRYIDELKPLSDNSLYAVRSTPGVAWAVRMYRGLPRAKAEDGTFRTVLLMGVDDVTLVGVPRKMVVGSVAALREPDAILIDRFGYEAFFPGQPYAVGRVLEMNDRRARIVGVVDASAPFVTFPVVYTRYSVGLNYQGQERHTLSMILVQPEAGVPPVEVCRRIQARTGLLALTRADFGWMTMWYYIQNTGIPVNFGVIVAVGIIVGTVVAGQTLYLFTLDNLRQYGALKAIGVTNRAVVGMVLLQSAVVGAIGYAFGIALCVTFFVATKDVTHLRGFITYFEIVGGTGVLMALIVLAASVLSVRRVVTLEPAVVFRG
jgi:putative ABC transport system permease protein